MKKKYLFYFVHPAKYHFFKYTINQLKKEGHQVDILITGRDILEELVKNEGWDYQLIFPKGRKIKGFPPKLSAVIYLVFTVYKLFWITVGKGYNLFVTDDLTTFIGRIIGVPSIFITDDDLSAVPESWILMITANQIFSPEICDLGKYNSKKIGYLGYKCLAHLHPNHFTPNQDFIDEPYKNETYFFIRTVSATSTHDLGRKGLTDETIRKIIEKLKNHGKIILNSERKLPEDLQKYVYNFNKNNVAQYLYHAKIFISDSTTMCAEAGILGTPSLEVDDWHTDFKQYQELNNYGLVKGFFTKQTNEILDNLETILNNENSKKIQLDNKNKMLNEKIDVAEFLIWICRDYPNSATQYFKDKSIVNQFK
jgi:uncharacterized protein